MKVLVTGATGFVGSHILDHLAARRIPAAVLLRPASDRRFIQPHLALIETRSGSILDPGSLIKSLEGVTHVIHCAGCTKASHNAEYYEINQRGTGNLVASVNQHMSSIQRFVHVSSLAVVGPALPHNPAREDSPLHPISEYGKSKLAGEREVREHCRVPFTILRPPAVYGPRDAAFLPMFRSVKRHLLPRPSRRQELSIVFAKDLAEATLACLEQPSAAMKTYFAASREVITAGGMAEEIKKQIKTWTVPCPLPATLLWLICFMQEIFSRASGRATLLNLQKFAELRAPGWVCDPSLLEKELGVKCTTPLAGGIAETLAWYQQERWL